jgi:DNA invertase Pin-like site-specific DNA recombinase
MVSGTSTDGREGLETLLQRLPHGDTLVGTRIHRLARSICDPAEHRPRARKLFHRIPRKR